MQYLYIYMYRYRLSEENLENKHECKVLLLRFREFKILPYYILVCFLCTHMDMFLFVHV